MLRICKLQKGFIRNTTKIEMYDELNESLKKLHEAKRDDEGRIKCKNAKLQIIVTGKDKTVKEYGKYMLNKIRKCGFKATNVASEFVNHYEMVVFNFFNCEGEQIDLLNEYIEKYRGVSLILLPYYNFSDGMMSIRGDGFYLQLGNKPKLESSKQF